MSAESLASIKIKLEGKAEDELGEAIKLHLETHRDVTLIDVIKFLYQSVLGSFHLLDHMTESEIETWINKNLAATQPEKEPLTEKLYGDKWVRVNLGAFKQKYGDDHKLLIKLFMKGKEEKRTLTTEFSAKLDSLLKLVVTGKIRPLNSNSDLPGLVIGFFANVGINFDFNSLSMNTVLLIGTVAIAFLGKIFGTLIVKPASNLSLKQLYYVGWAMNSRGAAELVIALVAFRFGLIPIEIFSVLVAMAMITTLTFPFVLSRGIKKNPGIMDEKTPIT